MRDNGNYLTKCPLLTVQEMVVSKTSLGCFMCLVSFFLYSVVEN